MISETKYGLLNAQRSALNHDESRKLDIFRPGYSQAEEMARKLPKIEVSTLKREKRQLRDSHICIF